jgi:hypothetical protein
MSFASDNFGRSVRDGTSCLLLCAKCKVQVITGLPHVCGESIITTLRRMVEERKQEILKQLDEERKLRDSISLQPANDNAETENQNEVEIEKVI